MNGILALATQLHVVAEANGGTSTIDVIAWIGIPLFIAFCGAVFGIVKGSIRFAQYMARSEETQDSIAKSNIDMRDTLQDFVAKTNTHLGIHDQEIAVLKFAVGPNGHPREAERTRNEARRDRDAL